MLGKLIKQEFKANFRTIPFVFLAVLIVNLLGIFIGFLNPQLKDLGYILIVLSAFAAVFVVIGLLASRFYKNLYKNEGYLMFMLPVRTESLLFAKLFTSTVWMILSGALFLGSAAVVGLLNSSAGSSFSTSIFAYSSFWMMLVELIIVMIVTVFTYLTIYYFCITLVNIFSSGKVGPGVGFVFFLGILFFLSIFEVFFLQQMTPIINQPTTEAAMMAQASIVILTYVIFSLAVSAIFFFVTAWMMRRKINLK